MARASWYRQVRNLRQGSAQRRQSYCPRIDELEDRSTPSLLPGNEFLVGASSLGYNSAPVLAAAPDGRSVVITTDTTLVNARLYNADGTSSTGMIQVNPTAGSGDTAIAGIATAMDAQGNFIVGWQIENGTLFGRRYDATGTALADPFQVTTDVTSTASNRGLFDLANNPAGAFVFTFSSFDTTGKSLGIFGQRYNAAGSALGTEFQITQFVGGYQRGSVVAMDGTGDFLVTWQSQQHAYMSGYLGAVYARRYDATGTPLGNEFEVSSSFGYSQNSPGVAMNAAGAFVISWNDQINVYARRFDATGASLGDDFRVNAFTGTNKIGAKVAMNDAGTFAVSWIDYGNPPSFHYPYYPQVFESGVSSASYAAVFNNLGAPISGEFQINQTFPGTGSDVAIDAQGDVFFSYAVGPFGSKGAFMRRYVEGTAGYRFGPAPGQLTITAPSGQTSFTFSQAIRPFVNYTFTLNGATQVYNSMAIGSVIVSAPGTDNVAVLATNDTWQDFLTPYAWHATSEIVSLGQGTGQIYKYDTSGNLYPFLQMTGFGSAYATLGLADQGQLLATYGVQNTFVSAGSYSYMSSPVSFYHISGSPNVYAYAAGPTDVAYHYDGTGASSFVVSGTAYTSMTGLDNAMAFSNIAVGFRFNYGISQNAGRNTAYFIDSPANDVFVGGTGFSYMYSADTGGNLTEYDSAMGFAQVYANSHLGGVDYAYVYDALHNHVSGFKLLT